MTPPRLAASVLGLGFLRPAPGTWASAAATLAALGVASAAPLLLLPLAALAWLLGFWAAGAVIREGGDTDPGWVVIDEVAGQWIALLPVALGVAHTGAAATALWPGWVAGFLLFRLLDVWKPSLIGRADRRGDALGLMLDDTLAGVAAALGVVALAVLAHEVLLR